MAFLGLSSTSVIIGRKSFFEKQTEAQLVKEFTEMLQLKFQNYLIPLKCKYFHRHFVSNNVYTKK
jgi:hypothetical protein